MTIAIARQPILDRERALYGYELLFRDGLDNALDALDLPDGTEATSQVISNSVLMFGIDALTGGGKAFINVTRDVLLSGHIYLLPKDTVIPEVPESVSSDREVIEACRKLKKSGFQIALDDIGPDDPGPLLEIADIVKVDFQRTGEERQRALVDDLGARGVTLIAEKIEEYDQFARAVDLGFDYFQGYFFARPETLSRPEIPGSKRQCLDLLSEINRPDLNFDELHNIIKRDVSLTYRLLRYLNSASFGFRAEIGSIRQALVMLGEKEIRKWATLISMATIGEEKPSELLVVALTRARFLEIFAAYVDEADRAQDLFLLGMFSLLDAVVDQPLDRCLEGMPIAEPILGALLGQPGYFLQLLELTVLYERGAWNELGLVARDLSISPTTIPDAYLNATRWARQTFSAVTARAPAARD